MTNVVSVSIVIFGALLVLYSVPANTSCSNCHCNRCPRYNAIAANLSDYDELYEFNLQLKNSMWNSSYPKLTKRGERYKKMVLHMMNSKVPMWQMAADTATSWLWTYLPQYTLEPDFSSFSRMISLANTDPEDCDYCKKVNHTLYNLVVDAAATDPYTIATTLRNAGCCYDDIPLSRNHDIHDSYSDALELWHKVGWEYPCGYQKAVLDLYRSCHYMDQLIAVIATASLTDHLQNMGTTFNITSALQVYQLQGITKIPETCCNSLRNDLAETLYYTTQSTLSSALYVKQQAGC